MEGFLIIDKPKGLTSHDVVEKVRRKFKVKAGHLGTLDPLATGVLPIAIGKATKLTSFFIGEDKEYEGEMVLGFATDTYDVEGRVIRRTQRLTVDVDKLKKILEEFKGEVEQIPPLYSALKVKGKRLYEWARQGVEVERKPRKAKIFALKLLNISLPYVKFYVHCSGGTYIRTLVNDIGEKLGCFATLKELKRIRSGPFHLKHALPLSVIEEANSILPLLRRMEEFLDRFKNVKVKEEFEEKVLHGTPVYKNVLLSYPEEVKRGEMVKIVDGKGKVLCIAESRFDGREIENKAENNIIFQPRKVLR